MDLGELLHTLSSTPMPEAIYWSMDGRFDALAAPNCFMEDGFLILNSIP